MGSAYCKLLRKKTEPQLYIEKLTTVETGVWTVPSRVRLVDVFLVGGGGSGGSGGTRFSGGSGGNGGQCLTVLGLSVTPGQRINFSVGGSDTETVFGALKALPGERGVNSLNTTGNVTSPAPHVGSGQGGAGGYSITSDGTVGEGNTCRDFGEPSGNLNAGGGGGGGGYALTSPQRVGGSTGRLEGSGGDGLTTTNAGGLGGGGYGGGGGGGDAGKYGSITSYGGSGGSGVIMIRYWR